MKEQVLALLREHREEYVSGEGISERLSVTRAAVWKAVRQLEEDGYVVESRSRRGYRLVSSPDIPYPWEIAPLLETGKVGRTLLYRREVDSTNNLVFRECIHDPIDGLTAIASRQVGGRGRLSGSWPSPENKGLYYSVVLTPALPLAEIGRITELAAASVCNVLRRCFGLQAAFRNPGDVLVEDRKLCGILTEAVGELESARMVVVGIGVHVNHTRQDLAGERDTTSLLLELGRETSLCSLLASLLGELDALYLRP